MGYDPADNLTALSLEVPVLSFAFCKQLYTVFSPSSLLSSPLPSVSFSFLPPPFILYFVFRWKLSSRIPDSNLRCAYMYGLHLLHVIASRHLRRRICLL